VLGVKAFRYKNLSFSNFIRESPSNRIILAHPVTAITATVNDKKMNYTKTSSL